MNVPKLRFLNFNNDYEIKEISDITYNVSSGKISKQLEDGEYNVYGSMGIIGKSNFYDYTGEKVLVARVGANAGSVNKINEKCCISDNTLVLEPKNILNDYLYYSLSHYDPKKLIFGSGQPLVTGGQLKKIKLGVPSKEEQVKVSNFLSLLDKKIELQSKKIEDLKLFKKGLHNQLFNEIDGEDYLLSDIAKFENGKGHENIVDENGNYILINSKFISTEGSVIKNCSEQLTPLYKDDITMVMSDLPNGKALAKCYYIEFDNKYSLNQRICRISIKDKEEFNPKYLFYTLNRNPYYLKFDDGVNQTNLKKDDILNINLNIPDKTIQDKNANILTLIDKIINKELSKLDSLNSLKKGLIQNMFV